LRDTSDPLLFALARLEEFGPTILAL
jgi:hypothetical protein